MILNEANLVEKVHISKWSRCKFDKKHYFQNANLLLFSILLGAKGGGFRIGSDLERIFVGRSFS